MRVPQLEDPFKFFGYENIVHTLSKDMPRTVQEALACKAMIDAKYAPLLGTCASFEDLPPFPRLVMRPQLDEMVCSKKWPPPRGS